MKKTEAKKSHATVPLRKKNVKKMVGIPWPFLSLLFFTSGNFIKI
jgi:hypothetical protein